MRRDHPLLEQRRRLAAAGAPPPWIALFDIDSTLMDTSPRNRAILKAAADRIPGIRQVWPRLDLEKPFWNVVEPVRRAGLTDEAVLREVRAFWEERFFTDEWIQMDEPYPGVAAFLHALKDEGFGLAYLTGRHRQGMETGTRASFARYGLPAGPSETFFFKPDFSIDDLDFKTTVCREIEELGTLVLSVDNEPANANLFRSTFPAALTIWLDTVTSPAPAPLLPGIERRDIGWYLEL